MSTKWRDVPVFISSTFRDMHAERDWLNRFVFPELRSRCQKRGVEFVGIEIRWGLTAEKDAPEVCREGTATRKLCSWPMNLCTKTVIAVSWDVYDDWSGK